MRPAAAASAYAQRNLPSRANTSPEHRPLFDRSRLAPEDAASPPANSQKGSIGPSNILNNEIGVNTANGAAKIWKDKTRNRSKSRKRKAQWKRLLWVKNHGYPDNYTDPPTFLSAWQRNPRLRLYDFWPLVADSTVIVQHVCAVAIFICCFVGIYQEYVSPVSIVSWASAATALGWVFWDTWVGQDERARSLQESTAHVVAANEAVADDTASIVSGFSSVNAGGSGQGLGLTLSSNPSLAPSRPHSRNVSATSLQTLSSVNSPIVSGHPTGAPNFASFSHYPQYNSPTSSLSPRNQQRLATIKSSILICSALLGLSPILKSLTRSTSSDSIWALSAWLMTTNVLFFDYSGGVGVKFPASLSTNAALMASTVLASRLESTTSVFSLSLFSIEVFGLLPVFCRHLRHRSWDLHVVLTVLLIIGAGAGLGVTLVGPGWKSGIIGVVFWGVGNALAMGGCSMWLIGLQKYKNVVVGPWDPARPIIRGSWD